MYIYKHTHTHTYTHTHTHTHTGCFLFIIPSEFAPSVANQFAHNRITAIIANKNVYS